MQKRMRPSCILKAQPQRTQPHCHFCYTVHGAYSHWEIPELRVCILEKSYSDDIPRLDKAIHPVLEDAEQYECGIDANGNKITSMVANEKIDKCKNTY